MCDMHKMRDMHKTRVMGLFTKLYLFKYIGIFKISTRGKKNWSSTFFLNFDSKKKTSGRMIFENPIVPTFGEKTRDTHLFIFAYSHLMQHYGSFFLIFIFLWVFPAETSSAWSNCRDPLDPLVQRWLTLLVLFVFARGRHFSFSILAIVVTIIL